jgi:lipooligosaccharide transport system ATP-binding protein
VLVALSNVSKRFGARVAVDRLDLAVPPGVCFGLLGPNGAGKTTTLRMVYGVTRPTTGDVRVFGLDVTREARAVRARIGVTLQESVLIDAISPVENLRVFGHYHLLREPALSRRIEEVLDFLELRSHAHVPVKTLSGGFRRRLAVALSLMNQPELLVLDEPTTGLDPAVRLALWSRVRELQAHGTTVLLTTHYMDEAQRLCDRVAIIAGGRVVADAAPEALILRHLAAEAVELDCTPEEERALASALRPRARLRVGGRVIFYADDAAALVADLRHSDHGDRRRLVVRPTNLEDVFLALTGTSLEGA